jgi:hypothetical protein
MVRQLLATLDVFYFCHDLCFPDISPRSPTYPTLHRSAQITVSMKALTTSLHPSGRRLHPRLLFFGFNHFSTSSALNSPLQSYSSRYVCIEINLKVILRASSGDLHLADLFERSTIRDWMTVLHYPSYAALIACCLPSSSLIPASKPSILTLTMSFGKSTSIACNTTSSTKSLQMSPISTALCA